ncbi:HEAT repeat domain-containing protein [Nocardia xishanensis]|uniref:HEAT repeat domain-containing protein n=1 Tax=Nocardia xishanensis TaxID=238964 RepID=UPI001470FDD2|nr:HEAT repeat domain-containing protein [Nocardia xishanensis]
MINSLVAIPGRPTRGTPRDILEHFGVSDGKKLGLDLIQDAIERCDRRDVRPALVVAYAFGIDSDYLPSFLQLAQADWHQAHEDIAFELGKMRSPRAIEALFHLARWVPDYLAWDDNRALASKAIWALGGIPGPEAERALLQLQDSENQIVRSAARKQLARRRSV